VSALLWALTLVAAVAWPGRIIGPLDGAPFDVPVEALAFGVALPALWVLHPAFLKTSVARGLIVALLGWKLLAWVALPQGGWCGMFLTKNPSSVGGYRLAPGWDVRTWEGGRPPTCSAIVARAYSRQTQFPAWIMNVPYGQDRILETGEPESLFFENPRPPDAGYALLVQGTMAVPSRGTLTIETGSDVRLAGHVDGQSLAAAGGATAAAPLEAGTHVVDLQMDLTGRSWRFIPQWNGAGLFSSVATSTAPLTARGGLARQIGRHVTAALFAALFGTWLFAAVAALRPGTGTLASVAAVAAAAAWSARSGQESTTARLAVLLLFACVAIPVPRALRTARGAWLLVGVPWLAMVSAIAFRSIGGFRLYLFGDDSLTYQRFAYRIFMEGYWLEGGQRTFWNQPLYRWLCGTLHVFFGDSSAGELLLDGFAVLVGAMFAFHVAKPFAGFRGGLAAAVAVVVTVALGPNWYMLGRGLSEIVASMWIYLAALSLMKAREGSSRDAIAAGAFATLAFYTRLNHLPLIVALAALLLPASVPAGAVFTWQSWRELPWRIAAVYVLVVAAGVVAFAARTWYYTGLIDPFAGTTRLHNATGLGLTFDSLWSASAWHNALESVLMIVTVQDPPRFDIRSVLVVAGFGGSLLALLRAPIARRLPLGVAMMSVAAVAGGLVARGVAYPGRFSIHLIPVAVAIAVSIAAMVIGAAVSDGSAAGAAAVA
jgi:hypothetical protein